MAGINVAAVSKSVQRMHPHKIARSPVQSASMSTDVQYISRFARPDILVFNFANVVPDERLAVKFSEIPGVPGKPHAERTGAYRLGLRGVWTRMFSAGRGAIFSTLSVSNLSIPADRIISRAVSRGGMIIQHVVELRGESSDVQYFSLV